MERVVRAVADRDRIPAGSLDAGIEIVEGGGELHDPAGRGKPLGASDGIVGQPIQGQMHLDEGGRECVSGGERIAFGAQTRHAACVACTGSNP
jgi:hypothetical protein